MKTQLIIIAVLLCLLTGCIRPDPASVPPQPLMARAPLQKMAYVRNGKLLLSTYGGTETQEVDACSPDAAYCHLMDLRWSPDGNYLLYFKYSDEPFLLYLVDGTGRSRPFSGASRFALAIPTWSADGQQFLYGTTTPTGFEVWLTQAPFVDAGHKVGDVQTLGDGCGGGGFPATEELYIAEGLGTFPYHTPPPNLLWLANDVVLYARYPCPAAGIGQFDLQTGQPLPRIDEDRAVLFTTNRQRDHWAAITQDHHLAIGSAEAGLLATRPVAEYIPDPNRLESMAQPGVTLAGGVFYGPTSGRLYYTTRQLQAEWQLDEAVYATLDESVIELFPPLTTPQSPIYQTTLWATTPTALTEPELVWQGDAYGIGSVTETANGDILFVRIDNGEALYAALQAKLSAAEVQQAWPKPQIMRIPAAGGTPELLLDNAGQLALSPPVAE